MANNISAIAESIQIFGSELMLHLKKRLEMSGLVNRNYDGAASAPGSIVNVPFLNLSGTSRTRTTRGAVTVDDMASGNVQVTMGQVYKAAAFDNLDKTFTSVNLMTETARRLATSVAEGIDAQITALWNYIPYEVGEVDGTALFNSTDKWGHLGLARKKLMTNKAPLDRLYAVINPTEAYNMRTLAEYVNAYSAGGNVREAGNLGSIYGFEIRESQSIGSSTLTTTAIWGTPALVGAHAIGATSISLNGLGTGSLKKGSTIVLASNAYVLTADATITTNAATASIYPALKTAFSGGETGTIVGHSAAGSENFAFHPDAFLLVMRPMAPYIAGSGVTSYQVTDEDAGLSLRLSIESTLTGTTGTTETLLVDALVGAAVVQPDLAVRMTGQI